MRVDVGHALILRGCNTTNPSTMLAEGVDVGHFGGRAIHRWWEGTAHR